MQIYYINVDAHLERRAFMDGQLHKLGLSATRLRAVTPAEVLDTDIEAACNPRRSGWIMPMELSCSLSHLRAMQALLDSGAAHALILEDDAVLSVGLPRFLEAFDARPPDFDVVRLETRHQRLRLLPAGVPDIGGIGIFHNHSVALGAAGYIVSRSGAAKIVASPQSRLHAIDTFLFNPYISRRKLNVLQAKPALVIQADQVNGPDAPPLPSLLTDRNRKTELQRPHFWRRLPGRIGGWIERDIIIGTQKIWHQHIRGARKTPVPFTAE